MLNVKILGSGCSNCKTTQALIEKVAEQNNIDIEVEKVEDIEKIMRYGIMSTPGVVINGKVVHAGGVPDRKKILGWLKDG